MYHIKNFNLFPAALGNYGIEIAGAALIYFENNEG
jgi:hypothetical protein